MTRRERIEALLREADNLQRQEEATHEALQRTPDQLRSMDALTLREHIADCARAHGIRDTTPAWVAFRHALDALAERDGAEPRSLTMQRGRQS